MLIGLSGQISIGHGAFMAIGGYAAALLLHAPALAAGACHRGQRGGHAPWPAPSSGVAAARLRGPYLAGATLMLAVALPSIADQYQGVFGGDQGLDVSSPCPAVLGRDLPAHPVAGLGVLRWPR